MSKIYTYMPPINLRKGIDSPLTTEYDSLLTNNKTLIGAINELYRSINGDVSAICGTVLSGEVLCGEGVDTQSENDSVSTFLMQEFINRFGGE